MNNNTTWAQTIDVYNTSVTFPNNYVIGDYIEFAQATPIAASASGYYEISIAYTRGGVAAAATHVASASHANSSTWKEAGRVNNNIYTYGATRYNFTIDVNPSNHTFRIRAVNTLGVDTNLPVRIKIRAINTTTAFTALSVTGNTTETIGYLPMTSDWDLIVGNLYPNAVGVHAIKVIANGNVGIGTTNPSDKLSVAGRIRAHEIKVETANWPDYVFTDSYDRMPLTELKSYITEHKHLPGMPSAKVAESTGVDLGEMNRKLLEKVEELTLYILDNKTEIDSLKQELQTLRK